MTKDEKPVADLPKDMLILSLPPKEGKTAATVKVWYPTWPKGGQYWFKIKTYCPPPVIKEATKRARTTTVTYGGDPTVENDNDVYQSYIVGEQLVDFAIPFHDEDTGDIGTLAYNKETLAIVCANIPIKSFLMNEITARLGTISTMDLTTEARDGTTF